jgi:lysophospholipase L1-like esterase
MNPVVLRLLGQSVVSSLLVSGLAIAVVVGVATRCRRPAAAALAFNVVAILGICLHAELILRVAFPDRVIPNLYGIRDGYYFNEPLLAQRFSTPEYAASYYTNVQGLRIAPEQNAYQRVDTADWLFIGDSFTQGAQVDFAEMFTSKLYQRFPDRVVVNAGTSGLGLGQEFNYFAREGKLLKPQLVILVLGSFNDFMNVEAPTAGPREHLMAASALARLLLMPSSDGEHLPLGRWTEPFQPAIQENVDYNVFYRQSSKRKAEDLRAFRETLAKFAGAVSEGGGRLLVALLPSREQVDPLALEAVLSAYGISESALDMRAPNDLARELTKELGVGFVDLLPAFREAGGGLFFEQDVHLTSRGHEVVARALGDYLEAVEGPSVAKLLSHSLDPERYPSFSQDGRQLVFQAVRGGASDLRLAGDSLEDPRWLTSTGVDETHQSLSRSKESLVFTVGSAESLRTDVVLLDLKTSARSVLTPGEDLFGAIPSFSRTGRQVVFAEWAFDRSSMQFTQPRIAVLDIASGKKSYLTSGQEEAWRPVFSPTDTAVVFIERVHGNFALKLFDLTPGTQTQLTETGYDEWDPQWAPDGGSIVYAAKADGNWDLFSVEVSTHSVSRITSTRGDEWDPFLSPDGKRLLYGGRFGSFEGILERPIGR